ncbi:Rieske (2Fe-2S) protein [Dyadobacter sp. CY261]|uniref:Rieske (2Fe-2S) protein n=1 Tax=Dyadobacter sp. CY261 TaxID=2907203 RepID=UPI0038D3B81C
MESITDKSLTHDTGRFRELCKDGENFLICEANSRTYIFESRCPHLNVPLSKFGRVNNGVLECSCHHFTWSLEDGTPISAPGCRPLKVFKTEDLGS